MPLAHGTDRSQARHQPAPSPSPQQLEDEPAGPTGDGCLGAISVVRPEPVEIAQRLARSPAAIATIYPHRPSVWMVRGWCSDGMIATDRGVV